MKKAKKTIYAGVMKALKKGYGDESVFDILEKLGIEMMAKIVKAKAKEAAGYIKNNVFPKFEDYALVKIKKNILAELKKKFDYDFLFETPPKGIEADLSIPCFTPAKDLKTSHLNLVRGVSDFINKRFSGAEGVVLKVSSEGGYANLIFKKERIAVKVLKEIEKLGDLYGASESGVGNFVMIDYSSPNIAKPMSVGHLRSTIIGNSLKNIYEFSGFSVISINHLGDWGTQFGKLLYALETYGDPRELKKNPFQEFLNLYVKFHEEAEKNKELEEKARKIFKTLENGKSLTFLLKWLEICDLSVKEFDKIYRRLDVLFDLTLGESFYKKMAEEVVEFAVRKGVARKEPNGPTIIEFKNSEFPSLLLQKSDEASLYAGRDLAAAVFRNDFLSKFKQLSKNNLMEKGDKENKIIYVVGNDQNLYFKQLFKILELLKIGDKKNFSHLGFGLVSLPDGKMSTRAGRVVFLDDLLDEAEKKAENLVKEKNPDLSEEEIKIIKKAIGISAVLYADLSQYREKNIVFTWDKMLNMKGDSSPYLQYAYARTNSILEKVGEFSLRNSLGKVDFPNGLGKLGFPSENKPPHKEISADDSINHLQNQFSISSILSKDFLCGGKEEENLGFMLAKFPEAVNDARNLGRPDKVANYLNDLVKVFNRFYENAPVLSSEGDTRNFRLTLVKSTGQVIKNGLWLLGIKIVDKM